MNHNRREEISLCQLRMDKKMSENTTIHSSASLLPFPEQLKKTYSSMVAKDYSNDILSHISSNNENQKKILQSHSITAMLRSKMVDWMIEVLSSYKMSE